MYKYFKRLFDLFFSLFVLIVTAPLLLIIFLFIRNTIGNPVFFKQERPGLNEKSFKMYKFRTMTDKKDIYGNELPDSERLTKLGAFLRKTSLDELPEFWNVIKGDMSVIGPRPLLMSYLPYYSGREKMRHNVKPGITGLAQISGRNLVNWDKRLELDAVYSEKMSFILDLKILFATVFAVFLSRGVAVNTQAVEPSLISYRTENNNNRKNI